MLCEGWVKSSSDRSAGRAGLCMHGRMMVFSLLKASVVHKLNHKNDVYGAEIGGKVGLGRNGKGQPEIGWMVEQT